MAKPRASAARLPGLAELLMQAFSMPPQKEDVFKAMSVNNVGLTGGALGYLGAMHGSPMFGQVNPANLYGPDLVRYWSMQDAHTPDKLTSKSAYQDLFARFPGSQFTKYYGPKYGAGLMPRGFGGGGFGFGGFGGLK